MGCTIGSGIFILTGLVANTKTGPALCLSYVLAAVACALTGLCYSEFASLAPSAGSAYAYARATLGEEIGWIIGWDLILEYGVSAAAVAQGFSHYLGSFLQLFGVSLPASISQSPFLFDENTLSASGNILDLPALCITLLITTLLVLGIKDSARFNSIMVSVKVAIVLFVIVFGFMLVDTKNWSPFAPFGYFSLSLFGNTIIGNTSNHEAVGVVAGAAIVFFAYIGFDSVSCNAEEAKHPARDVPIAILLSLFISTVLYVGVAIVITGMIPYQQIDTGAPLSTAFGSLGYHWAEYIIAIGALTGIVSVLLVTMLAQPRILLAMSRDGLLPESFFAAVHEKYKTPYKSTILTGMI